ncbi:MAG: ParB/RepB/Spo0J family partition protein [Pirellulales bacterium]
MKFRTEMIDTKLLKFDRNIRRRYANRRLEQMKESIRARGIVTPLLGSRESDFVSIIDGGCRGLAAIDLGLTQVPVTLVESNGNDRDMIREQMVSNTVRENLTPCEVAEGIDRLKKDSNKPVSELFAELGFTSNEAKKLATRKLPSAIQQQVDQGLIPFSSAYLLTRVKDSASQAELAAQIADGNLTREALEHILRAQKSGQSGIAKRFTKVQFKTPDGGSICVSGSELSLTSLVELLDWLMKLAKKEMRRGLELDTFVRFVRDQTTAEK